LEPYWPESFVSESRAGGVDVLAGQEVGNADREADDVATGGLERLGLFGHGHDRAGLGPAHPCGKLGQSENLG
jgi:hypothetical protein